MTRLFGFSRFALLVLVALTLALGAGCSRFGKKEPETETLDVAPLYEAANQSLRDGNWNRAALYYRRLIARFPYGEYTEQAQLDLAYAQYKANNFDDATSTIDRFIRTYPAHRHIDYAYYLRGLVNFDRDNAFLERIARLDMSQRDQASPRQSFNDFLLLVQRYPDSRYAPDARQRMIHLRNELARHDLNVGLYYLDRGAYVAAANRGKQLLENYPRSMHDGDAIALMGEAYTRLGEQALAADSRRVLEANHPDHPWLAGRWPERGGLWRSLVPFSGER
ncbi:outer membrane protein assembly factor BamD [Coralloluteibacterium thermophilus]|uniref:Outer membrane protein assembly factor BamD n=1 Tax=Coralloluteibacterium thermophilum TaxID=2707049 RepID=A0ABV9NEK2_9GAMM